jgi:hypothetical protein
MFRSCRFDPTFQHVRVEVAPRPAPWRLAPAPVNARAP